MAYNCLQKDTHRLQTDPHSYSNPVQARVTHLHWVAQVDFDSRVILATAVWEIEQNEKAGFIILDTKGLNIHQVTTDDEEPIAFKLGESNSVLGQPLTIFIRPDTHQIRVQYNTTEQAEALQWLHPQQTTGKRYPLLFTQSQAILARSWIPCQDSPGIRFTYTAEVTVPLNLLPLMSASNPQKRNDTGTYYFEMKQSIPAYLLALLVGDLAFHPVSARSGIYAEPEVLDRAAWEFEDLEKMVVGAEALYGDYMWERYDVVVLPPSFPFGGMENPRITFATPTILAGDRSLVSLIAHELAHSWSGNLVTNATWNDFWLNEGFTVYFEHRIVEKLYGRDDAEMLAVLALQDLKETIATMKAENNDPDTCLKLDLTGRSPDEAVTDIAYNKGYFLLRSIEQTHGRDKFDQFVRDYFAAYAFRSIDTEAFVEFVTAYYQSHFNIVLADLAIWIYHPGLPDTCPKPVSRKLEGVDIFIQKGFKRGAQNRSITHSWSTQEWLHLLKNLPERLSLEQLQDLDEIGNFTKSTNAEIMTLWLVIAVRHGYASGYERLEQFLTEIGRRKFLSPVYLELLKTDWGRKRAKEIYKRARLNYHFVATNTFDGLIE